MQWDASAPGRFREARPWLPVHPNYMTRNVAAQLKQPDSLLNVYKRLIALRRGNMALRRGDFNLVEQANPDCLVYQRIHGKKRMLVALNFSQDTAHTQAGSSSRVENGSRCSPPCHSARKQYPWIPCIIAG